MNTDRIEKEILLRAPRSRVWRALTDAAEFGAWFCVAIDGTFEVGKSVFGKLTIKGYENLRWEVVVEEIVPETRFSFRWHPFAIDPAIDYSSEPRTLVAFELADAVDPQNRQATMLTVVESGFDAIPIERRAKAFEMNSGGWAAQLDNIEKYLREHS